MTQLHLALDAPATVPLRHVQGSVLDVRADTPCVLAPGHDAVRDGVLLFEQPRGRQMTAAALPVGATAWMRDGARWRAMVRT